MFRSRSLACAIWALSISPIRSARRRSTRTMQQFSSSAELLNELRGVQLGELTQVLNRDATGNPAAWLRPLSPLPEADPMPQAQSTQTG